STDSRRCRPGKKTASPGRSCGSSCDTAGEARILPTVIWGASQSPCGDSPPNSNAVAPVARLLIMQILTELSALCTSSAIQQFIYDRKSSKTLRNSSQDGEQADCQCGEVGAPGGAAGERTARRI